MHRARHSTQLARFGACVAFVAILALSSSFTLAQVEDTSNAATWYQRAWEKQWSITNDEWAALDLFRAQGGKPSDEVREVLRKLAPLLDDARRATNLGFADFGVLPGHPSGQRVAHAGKLRGVIRWLDADVKARIADGDTIGAASQMAAMYRLIEHAGDGSMLVSSLASGSMTAFAGATLDYAIEERAMGLAELNEVLAAAEALNTDDPFQFVDGIASEQAQLMDRLEQYQQSGVEPTVEGLLELTDYESESVPGVENLNPNQMLAEIESYHNLLGSIAKLHESHDPERAAEEIEQWKFAAENGDLGPLCTVAAPAMCQAYESIIKCEGMLKERKAQLRGLLEGKVDPVELANAAAFYRRGIDHLNSIEAPWPEMLERLLVPEIGSPGDPRDQIRQAERRAIDLAIDEFTRGSHIRRCDFSTRRLDEEFFIPEYTSGMSLAFELLCAQAVKLQEAGRCDEAMASLATCLRMIGHLGSDGLVLSAIESHDAFLTAQRLVHGVLESAGHESDEGDARSISPARFAEVAAALRRTGPRDPLGYEVAMRQIDDKTDRYLRGRIAFAFDEWRPEAVITPGHTAADERARRWLDSLAPAERWYTFGLIMLNADRDTQLKMRMRRWAEAHSRPEIAAIIDLAEIDAPPLEAACRTGAFESLWMPAIEDWIELSARMKRARDDQRAGARLAESLTEMARAGAGVEPMESLPEGEQAELPPDPER